MEKLTRTEIEKRIHTIRSRQVLLDYDLAEMYEVETRVLNQAVKRNHERFPDSFRFRLNKAELASLQDFQETTLQSPDSRSQNVIMNSVHQ